MFTISCYALHPLAQRFVTLWRRVKVVSDWLTFLLSMLCCQWWAMMPKSASSSVAEDNSAEAYKILSEPVIDAGRASGEPFRPQHLVIDFTPQPGDSEEVGLKCQRFWEVVNSHPGLEGMMVRPETDTGSASEELSTSVPVHRKSIKPDDVSNFPAIQVMKNLEERGTIDTAFVAPTSLQSKH